MASRQETGRPLDTICGEPVETGRFLRLAVGIAAALAELHGRNFIHEHIEPNNILVDPVTSAVEFAGLPATPLLRQDVPISTTPRNIETTPAYMSPEQTGRLNRSVDHRTDLYSLGVTFYEMLTGALPFQAGDILEWVHCHIARVPQPPANVLPQIPRTLSDIVVKLLAKDPEDRYQTASGLRYDLEQCLDQWEAEKKIEPFLLGERDISDRLLIPQRLYGRERDIKILLDAFGRVVESGKTEMVMVAGYSGIGKTSLVRELYRPVVRERGYFVSGKFDQYKRDIPYSTVAEAFRELVRQLLTESEERIAGWKRQLQEALGVNGQLIADIIPQVELIVGPQLPVPELPPTEARNRFNMVFRQFMGVFTKKEHPLVVFFDDLQWVDAASLHLLEQILTNPGTRYLLLIGAYRDNEVGPSHPLMVTLDDIRQSEALVETITLSPLSFEDLGRLMADTFRAGAETVEPLTRLVQEKTAGNPFFVIQFLTTLYDEGLLRFDGSENLWKWDLARIREKGYTDNVVDLMVRKLKKLSADTLQELKLAASIGNRFDLHTLAVIGGTSEQETWGLLREAMGEGLVLQPEDSTYTFLHDRVQEAAYSLVPNGQRAGLCLRIGRLLLADTPEGSLEESIFHIVSQLNCGAELIIDRREKDSLRRLNILAGRKAKASIAYASALTFLIRATELLPADAWSSRYEETFALYLDRSECEYLVGNFKWADELFALLLANAGSDLDRARVYRLRSRLYQMAGRFNEAMTLILDALRLFGVTLPDSEEALMSATEAAMGEIRAGLAGRPVARLAEAPQAVDPVGEMVISLLVEGLGPAYAASPPYFPPLAAKAVSCSLRYGNTLDSCMAYNSYAIVLIALFGNIRTAFEFSETALALAERFDHPRTRGLVLAGHGGLVIPWRRHIARCTPFIERSLASLLDAGDFLNIGHMSMLAFWAVVEKGESLDEVLKASEKYATLARDTHNATVHETILLIRRLLMSLKGESGQPVGFDGGALNEAECLARFAREGWYAGIAYHSVIKQIVDYTYGRYSEALAAAARAEPVLRLMMAMPVAGTLCFYQALTIAALYPDSAVDEKEAFTRTLEGLLAKLKFWAENCPENFGNRHALVSAETARIEGRELEAERLYEEAIRSARDNGFIQNEAVAFELASRFYRARGFTAFADFYLRNAHACYVRWGAGGKVKQLDEQYPRLREEESPAVGGVDAITVVKASQAISGEMLLSGLLETLMRIVLENGAARKGCLLLARGGELSFGARAWVEGEEIKVSLEPPSRPPSVLPESVINYVRRTLERVILDDVSRDTLFSTDEYIRRNRPLSVLCLPILRQADLAGLLYLENDVVKGAFTPDRIAVLEVLAAQAAISLENSTLYAALDESRHLLQSIMDNSTAVVYIKDLEGHYLLINRRFEELLHVARDAVAGKTDYDLFPEARADAIRAFDRQVLAAGRAMEAEEVAPHDDGLHTYISIKAPLYDAEAKPYAVCGISTDITERKRAEEALRFSEARYRALHHDNPSMIFTLDTEGTVLSVNPFGASKLGYTADELVGRPVLQVFHEDDRPAVAEQLRICLRNPNQVYRWQFRKIRKDGEQLWVEELAQAVYDLNGMLNVLVVCQDITERKRAEEALRHAHEELEQRVIERTRELSEVNVKLREIDRLKSMFIASMSHELRTPLNSIIGFSRILLDEWAGSLNDEQKENLAIILRSGKHLLALINDVIDVSKIEAGKIEAVIEEFDVDDLIEEAVHLMTKDAGGKGLERMVESIHLTMNTDRRRLLQCVINLLGNAVKFTEKGYVRVAVRRVNDAAEISVEDTGTGIRKEDMPKLFRPFVRLISPQKAIAPGTGLGLYLTGRLVKEVLKGDIMCKSTYGRGSIFSMRLPIRIR